VHKVQGVCNRIENNTGTAENACPLAHRTCAACFPAFDLKIFVPFTKDLFLSVVNDLYHGAAPLP
jgi:hypothetical protein